MTQIQLPFFPEGVTHITAVLAFRKQDGRVTYFNGSMPVFVHEEEDVASFRMITAQFCVNGNAKQAEIVACLRGVEDQSQAGGKALPRGGTERVLYSHASAAVRRC